jgi:hypothetical protein
LAGHGDAAEAEKDCSGDYAERFHGGISKLIGRCRLQIKVCRMAAGTIKLQFRELNSILMRAVDRTSGAGRLGNARQNSARRHA